MRSVESLGTIAAAVACRAAIEWCRVHGQLGNVDIDQLTEAVRFHARMALPDALEDAREALDAHMGAAAEQTFRASMALAGIAAAREACPLERSSILDAVVRPELRGNPLLDAAMV